MSNIHSIHNTDSTGNEGKRALTNLEYVLLIIVIALVLALTSALSDLHYIKHVENCMDYGYKRHSSVHINDKTDMLYFKCVK